MPQTYIEQCSRWNTQEVAYLGQRFYGANDYEIYHSDLDNELSKAPAGTPAGTLFYNSYASGAYAGIDNQSTAVQGYPLLGVDSTFDDLHSGATVAEPWTSYLTQQADYPCPVASYSS